jgi:hypothetical protein
MIEGPHFANANETTKFQFVLLSKHTFYFILFFALGGFCVFFFFGGGIQIISDAPNYIGRNLIQFSSNLCGSIS